MRKIPVERIDYRLRKILRTISKEADRRDICAFLVGGFVRDLLLARKNFDLDIVMESDAISFAKALFKGPRAKVTTHQRFGTVSVVFVDGQRVDLATARRESYPYPGALPAVEAGSMTDDLFRRDFTINAMAAGINKDSLGRLVDPFGGKKDLKAKRIRILHGKSFLDDPTRVLRAVRFEQRFNFKIENKTLRLLKAAVRSNFYQYVKPQRYFAEFRKILNEERPSKYMMRLNNLGALNFISPRLRLTSADRRLLVRIEKMLHSLRPGCLYERQPERWLLFFMALCSRLNKQKISKLVCDFNLNKENREAVKNVLHAQQRIRALSKKELRPSEIFRILNPLGLENILFLRCLASSSRVGVRIDQYLRKYSFVRLIIKGGDLRKIGIFEGRQVGVVLSCILNQKMDGKVKTKQDELRLVREFMRRERKAVPHGAH